MDHNQYSKKILNELSDKYHKNFELIEMFYEVDGNHGNYYRAICKEQGSENTFVAYYYLKGSDYLLANELSEEPSSSVDEALLVDAYPELLLNLKVADYVVNDNDGALFAVADIGTFEHRLTVDEVEKGMEYCLSNDLFDTQLKIYLFASDSIKNKAQFEQDVMQKMLSMNIYKQSLDVAYIAAGDLDVVKSEYGDDIYRIEDRLEEDEKIVRYSWYFAERGKGITKKKDVKGV